MSTTTVAPITITPTALIELRNIRKNLNVPEDYGLRIGVKGGGCAGFSYILGFDEPKEGDTTYEVDGLKVLMQPAHGMYLLGMEIDWVDGLDNRGFSFNNPNATDNCGCGTSFSA